MKKLLQVFIAVLVFGTTLAGCKKDDDDSVKNYFKVGDTEYELSSATLVSWDETNVKGVFDVDLILCSKNLEATGPDTYTGKGNALYFETYSSSRNDLPDGSYNYGLESNQKAGAFWSADVKLNYDSSTEKSETHFMLNAGTVTVKKSGSDYEINISCTGANGKAVTGYYKGSLTKY
jgi:hypothetical protein